MKASKHFTSAPVLSNAKPLTLISNHFPLELKDAAVHQFHLRFIRKEELPHLLADSNYADEEAVQAGSRLLIQEIQAANRRAVHRVFGEVFYSENTMFAVNKNIKKHQ